ncbi:GRASP55/65 family protein [Podospora didyma]|uniref:GRASP55/65 family protein n=1 Tax=Podospora didyma TaxID=330526 RepID=A0AAE0P7H7_9PEZI|nr:GRASP55/65 family protein [Podospora didyma]
MFNALNRIISRLDGDASAGPKENTHGAFGFQVLRNANLQLAVEPWFDFIVAINGRTIDDSDPGLFAQEVRNCAGGAVTLGLWSAKGQRTRSLHVPVPADTASLGLALQWSPLSIVANIWHVLDVPANSPADAAGLLPYSDYILGTPEGVLHGEGGLSELVEDHIGQPLRLYVYNNEYNVTREVTIQPSRDWGGEGALGCVLGYGALHRLPAPLSEPVHLPGETLFDGDSTDTAVATGAPQAQFVPAAGQPDVSSTFVPAALVPPLPSPEYLVPANLASSAPPPGGAPPRSSKKKDRHSHHSPNQLMDDYFKEQEKRSRELDNVPSRHASPLPPPPKTSTGGPPRAPPKAGEEASAPPPPGGADEAED